MARRQNMVSPDFDYEKADNNSLIGRWMQARIESYTGLQWKPIARLFIFGEVRT